VTDDDFRCQCPKSCAQMSEVRDHGITRATAYRYRGEVIIALAEQSPQLSEALERATDEGLSHVILDGKIIPVDRGATKQAASR
jgi:hypothetical protein